jgi:hypothetical protein
MRQRRLVAGGIVLASVWVACTFSTRIDNVAIDATPDAGPCKEAPAFECADGTTLRTCITVGIAPAEMPCSWGCKDTGSQHHCGVIVPSGGGATIADTDPTTFGALGDLVIDVPATIDGTAGTISGVTAGFVHALRAGDTIAVFRVKSLTINAPIKLVGVAAIVFVADGPIVVNAVIDAKGSCGSNDLATLAGPGGFSGGLAAATDGSGSGGGKGAIATGGAGGGGHGGSGGSGGTGAAAQLGGNGGVMAGTPTIDALVGGAGGGATDGAAGRARGGGGGGALQLVSNTKIVLASGGINAGGCAGDSGQGNGPDGGGGGGAGGAILLEAPIIEGVDGKLAVNGGGGGAGDDATEATGGQATLSRIPAAGAQAATDGGSGGSGGAGATYAGTKAPDNLLHAGGGGGGVGRIRLNTRSGDVAATGEMSPALTDANSTCTAGSANVQ